MQRPQLRRLSVSGAYFLLFTALLLMPHPEWLLGGWEPDTGEWTSIDLFALASYVVHFVGFAVLVFTTLWSLPDLPPRQRWQFVLAAALYGIIIEFVQRVIPNRSFDPWDMIANAAGGVLGCIIWQAATTAGTTAAAPEPLRDRNAVGQAPRA